MERESGNFLFLKNLKRLIEAHFRTAAASLGRAPGQRVIDQNPPHHACGDRQKLRAITPVNIALLAEPEISFVNQGRRLQGVAGPFLPEATAGDGAEFII
jgi:hypothetical protein